MGHKLLVEIVKLETVKSEQSHALHLIFNHKQNLAR